MFIAFGTKILNRKDKLFLILEFGVEKLEIMKAVKKGKGWNKDV